jgi:hypothetical protein
MKKTTMILKAVAVCLFLASGSISLMAQDASHMETATAEDSSDWGLLGLLGLIGLLGLKKKKRVHDIDVDQRGTSTARV